LVGLLQRKSYQPRAGWGLFLLQVLAGAALLVIYLLWAAQAFDWIALRAESLKRIGLLALVLSGAVALYLGAVWAAGLNLRQFLRR
jgi:putative peptidoglycan lipid II flippase